MELNILEKIPVEIFPDETDDLSKRVAQIIADKINEKNSKGGETVLGLATGNSPLNVYRELIRLHKKDGLDFSHVVTFNLDEYYGLGSGHVNSYHEFMWENLFNHINIRGENVNILDGTVSIELLDEYCRGYEKDIETAGGIDIQLLGIGFLESIIMLTL